MADNTTKTTSQKEPGSYKLSYTGKEVNKRLGQLDNVVAAENGIAVNLKVTGLMDNDYHAVNVGWVNKQLVNYVSLSGTRDDAPIMGNLKLMGKVYDGTDNRALFTYDLLRYGGYNTTTVNDGSTEVTAYHNVYVPTSELDPENPNISLANPGKKDSQGKQYTLPKYKFPNLAFLPDKLLGNPKQLLKEAGSQQDFANSPEYGYGITDVKFTDKTFAVDPTSIGKPWETTGKYVTIQLGTATDGSEITRDVAKAAETLRGYNIKKIDTGLTGASDGFTTRIIIGGEEADLLNSDTLKIIQAELFKAANEAVKHENKNCIKITYKGKDYFLQGQGKTLKDYHLDSADDDITIANGIPTGDNPAGAFTQAQISEFLRKIITEDLEFSGNKKFNDAVEIDDTLDVSGATTLKDDLSVKGDAWVNKNLTVGGEINVGADKKGAVHGTADQANKLTNKRKINGTDFDGTADITTDKWGTARNITVKDADETNAGEAASVDGHTNVTLKLPANIKATKFTGALEGNADSATKLTSNAGTAEKPIYFSDGKPAVCNNKLDVSIKGDADGNAGSATKLQTSRNLKVNLGSTTAQSFDGSAAAESIGVSGTLPIANGGTGKTSWGTNKLHYGSFSELALPGTDGSFLRQNKTGAPFFSTPAETLSAIGGNVGIRQSANSGAVVVLSQGGTEVGRVTVNNVQNSFFADTPTGFVSSSRQDSTWGNRTGSHITEWAGGDNCAIKFRKNNPESGAMSMLIGGTVYVNEGTDRVFCESYLPTGVKDATNGSKTTFNYGAAGLTYSNYTWLAGWNGYELRAVAKSQFAQAAHYHTYLDNSEDTRSANTAPSDYFSKFRVAGLKYNNALGINSQQTYSTVLGINGWSDASGGGSHELAFDGANEKIYYRHGSSTWGAWKAISFEGHTHSQYLTSHQSLSNYVTLDGSQTITGTKTFKSGLTIGAQDSDKGRLTFSDSNHVYLKEAYTDGLVINGSAGIFLKQNNSDTTAKPTSYSKTNGVPAIGGYVSGTTLYLFTMDGN